MQGPEDTVKCMKEMSQKAWEHISTGPLFRHMVGALYKDYDQYIPEKIADLLEEDTGMIHAYGLIVLLVEARFDGREKVFVQAPENHLHPGLQRMLMSLIYEIQKIPMGGGERSRWMSKSLGRSMVRNYIWVIEEYMPRADRWKPCDHARLTQADAKTDMKVIWMVRHPEKMFRVRRYTQWRR